MESLKQKIKESLWNIKHVAIMWIVAFASFAISTTDNKLGATTTLAALSLLAASIWIVLLFVINVIGAGKKFVNVAIPKIQNKQAFKRELLEVLSDQVITENEEAYLKKRKEELGISDEDYAELRKEQLNKEMKPLIKDIVSRKRFSPEDEERLLKVAEHHRIAATFDDQFKKYRLLWEIENTGTFTPQPIEVDIRLANNEICYMQIPSIWKQTKKIRQNTGYVGGSVGFRVAKGVTLRVGRAIPTYKEYEDIVPISSGTLYITNKKLIFVGKTRSTNITMGRLVDYNLYRDAIEIQKTTGKPDIFKMDEDDILILDALLQVL